MAVHTEGETRLRGSFSCVLRSIGFFSMNPQDLYGLLEEPIWPDSGRMSEEEAFDANAELVIAARYGETEEVEELLKGGANVDHQDETGNTALHKACANNYLDVVKVLVKGGAKLLPNESGNSPLHWAIQNKAVPVVKFLLTNCPDADVLKANKFGKSCSSEAFAADNIEILNLVLSHPSAKGLEDQYAKGANGAAAADAAGPAPSGAEVEPMEADESEESNSDNTAAHPKDSKIAQTLVHQFKYGEHSPVYVREVVLDWNGAVFDADASRDTTGLHVWASAVLFGQHLYSIRDRFQGKTVCELGAGCGLPGLLAYAVGGAARVVMTDFFDHTLTNLKHNLEKNQSTFGSSNPGEISVQAVDWAYRHTYPAGQFDILLGCDLIYDVVLVPLLVTAIDALLAPEGVLYYAYGGSRQGAVELIESLKSVGLAVTSSVPAANLAANPLVGKTDTELHVYFNELEENSCTIVEVRRIATAEAKAARRAELEELVRKHQEAKAV
eukprot:m.53442 g.53442  ORF g.53442 m.53442 type:complete len:499 (+) comp6483_c0_seq1:1863-3359(+)